jgi:hypothetical protein
MFAEYIVLHCRGFKFEPLTLLPSAFHVSPQFQIVVHGFITLPTPYSLTKITELVKVGL